MTTCMQHGSEPYTQRRAGDRVRVERLLNDPRFRQLSLDGRDWINPYSGDPVWGEGDPLAVARSVLLNAKPWLTGSPLDLGALRVSRWYHWLCVALPQQERLRFFHPRDGRWLNPISGDWEDGLCRPADGRLGRGFAMRLAQRLAACPLAYGLEAILSVEELRRRRDAA